MNIYRGGKILNTMEYHEKNIKYRPMHDTEIKALFEKIKLNTGFALPDKITQDFINDGSIVPPFKKCGHFNKNDFSNMIVHIKKRKNIKKLSKVKSKPSTKKKNKNKNKKSKSKDMLLKPNRISKKNKKVKKVI